MRDEFQNIDDMGMKRGRAVMYMYMLASLLFAFPKCIPRLISMCIMENVDNEHYYIQ